MEYQKPYLHLFNTVTDALEQLKQQNYGVVKELLIRAQQEAEELFISAEDEALSEL